MCRQVNYLSEKDANLPQMLTDLENRLIGMLNLQVKNVTNIPQILTDLENRLLRVNNTASRFSLMMSEEVRNLSALVIAETEILKSKTASLTSITTSLRTTTSALKVQHTHFQTYGESRDVKILRQATLLDNAMKVLRRQQDQLDSLKREHGLVIKSIRAHACSCTKVFAF